MAERKKRGTAAEEPIVEETPVVAETNTTEGNIDELVAVIDDLNNVLGLDPPLPTEGEYDEMLAAVTESAKEVLAEDQKDLTPDTWAFLQVGGMLGHLPAPKASKAEKPAKVEKPVGEKKKREAPDGGFKKSPHAEERNKMIEDLIAAGKYTAIQIVEKVMEKYPEEKKTSVQTIVSDAKNPKYTKFSKTAKVGDNKIMSF